MRWLKLRLRLRRHPNAFELLPFLSNPYTGSLGHLLGEFHPITNHFYILLPWQSGLTCNQPQWLWYSSRTVKEQTSYSFDGRQLELLTNVVVTRHGQMKAYCGSVPHWLTRFPLVEKLVAFW
jgi:hypothetical protein